VNVDLIDKLMNLAGELVLGRNQLRKALDEAASANPMLDALIQSVDVVTSEVQEKIMQMRMQPLGNLFNKYRRVVRDLSQALSKEVELVVEGRNVELDRSILEGLSDPMTHLIRNALDHGIEDPHEREAAGKSRHGTLQLRAFHKGGQVNITVTDDGRGIDPEHVAAKAVERGVLTPDQISTLSGKEKKDIIFMPGFSTVDDVSDISGRGVGMDVVRTNIETLGGHLEVESEKGRGATVRIRLPLTLAIIPSLIVGAGGHRFAIPQINVKELICVRAGEVASRIEGVAGAEVLRVRESLLPLIRITDVLGLTRRFLYGETGEWKRDRRRKLIDRRGGLGEERKPILDDCPEDRRNKKDRRQSWRSDLYVVVLKLGENRFGLCVEELFDTEEIVVKPLSEHLKSIKCFAGATIMGDGGVAMILDTSGIAERQGLRFKEITAEERKRREEAASRAASVTRERLSVLVFNGAPDEHFALPLQSVSRLEKVDPHAVHRIGEQEYMDYRGESLPLIRLDRYLSVSPLPAESNEFHVIIPKTRNRPAGFLVSSILDTREVSPSFQETKTRGPGILGSAFLEGRLTLFLNAEEILALFDEENADRRSSRKGEAA
jgi:two-component system chemotaxis sensor kinase CheA